MILLRVRDVVLADWGRARQSLPRAAVLAPLAVVIAHGSAPADTLNHKAQPRRSVPATVDHAAPDTTGAIPNVAQPSTADAGVLPPPFTLPKAPRARMRACGHKWEAMKQVGATGDDIWRDFATKCLAAKDDPVVEATSAGDMDGAALAPSR